MKRFYIKQSLLILNNNSLDLFAKCLLYTMEISFMQTLLVVNILQNNLCMIFFFSHSSQNIECNFFDSNFCNITKFIKYYYFEQKIILFFKVNNSEIFCLQTTFNFDFSVFFFFLNSYLSCLLTKELLQMKTKTIVFVTKILN